MFVWDNYDIYKILFIFFALCEYWINPFRISKLSHIICQKDSESQTEFVQNVHVITSNCPAYGKSAYPVETGTKIASIFYR